MRHAECDEVDVAGDEFHITFATNWDGIKAITDRVCEIRELMKRDNIDPSDVVVAMVRYFSSEYGRCNKVLNNFVDGHLIAATAFRE